MWQIHGPLVRSIIKRSVIRTPYIPGRTGIVAKYHHPNRLGSLTNVKLLLNRG